uniref:ParB-like N-terminal domain-containing protein n=1 Tax=viral metagenome TaxID=1070528 RepID=A0A6M3IM54_9ZZZZ
MDIREIQVDRIVPDPDQPRKTFDKAKLFELGRSMIEKGQLEAVEGHLDPEEPETFILTDGERRWRAACLVGMTTLRMEIVEPKNPADKLMRQMLHNSGEPHTIMELANGYRRAIDVCGMEVGDVAKAFGKTVDLIEKDLPLADLHETVQADVDEGVIGKEVARRIATLPVDKHVAARDKAVKSKNAKSQMAAVDVYIKQVKQQKLWDDNGTPADEAMLAGQKLVSFMQTFTKLHNEGHLNGKLSSAVKARSRRTPDFKAFAKSLARFAGDLEKHALDVEAIAKANEAVAA